MPTTFCTNCGAADPRKRCCGCRAAVYCSVECQAKHWRAGHSVACRAAGSQAVTAAEDVARVAWETFLNQPKMRSVTTESGFGLAPRAYVGSGGDDSPPCRSSRHEHYYFLPGADADAAVIAATLAARDIAADVLSGRVARSSADPARAAQRGVRPSARKIDVLAELAAGKCDVFSHAAALVFKRLEQRGVRLTARGRPVKNLGVCTVPMPADAPTFVDVYADPGTLAESEWPHGRPQDYDVLGSRERHCVNALEAVGGRGEMCILDLTAIQLLPRERRSGEAGWPCSVNFVAPAEPVDCSGEALDEDEYRARGAAGDLRGAGILTLYCAMKSEFAVLLASGK